MPQQRGRGEGSIRQRRRADGSVFWEARASIQGKQKSFYAETKTGAAAKARAAKVDADRGNVAPTSSITVAAYLAGWLQTAKRAVRGRTYAAYESHVRVHIVPALGRVKLVDLSPAHVRTMLASLLHDGKLSENTVGHVRATLSGALKLAMVDHGLVRNAASLARVPKSSEPTFKPEVITPAEARQIVAALHGSRLEPLVMFAAATGVRQGELLALRWRDLDLENRVLKVRHAIDIQDGVRLLARPKTKKAVREVRLSDLAMRAIEIRQKQRDSDRLLAGNAWEGDEIVFANKRGGIRDGSAVNRNFQAALTRRGIAPIRWHALRRVFAAVLQDNGVGLPQIRDLMGHSQIRVTEGYAYTMPEALKDAIDAIDVGLNMDGEGAEPIRVRKG